MNEIQLIENYLDGTLPTTERISVEARMSSSYAFRLNVTCQRILRSVLHRHHVNNFREQVRRHHSDVFNNPQKADYRKSIEQLFNP